MAISSVNLMADAYLVCSTHALSTEKEEIMGLLIGEIDTNGVCHISSVTSLQRSDKRADRVEISPEQLAAVSNRAEVLAREWQRPLRVVGWYHSHPHITVWPSHVDVHTQAMYQVMDEGFVGLIFSVFNEDKATKNNRVQVTCFQAINQSPNGEPPNYVSRGIPFHITVADYVSKPCLEALFDLPKILTQEEEEAYDKSSSNTIEADLLTKVYNGSVFTKSLCQIMSVLSGPLIDAMEDRLQRNRKKLKDLEKLKQQLLQELEVKATRMENQTAV